MAGQRLITAVLHSLLFAIARFMFIAYEEAKVLCKKLLGSNQIENIGYENSARLEKVISSFIFDPWVTPNKPGNIISRHVKNVHPGYVLKDEVSLYCLTKDEAWFVEAREGVEVWKTCYSPFHKIAQLENAMHVIRMPLQSLYRLSKDMDEIDAKIVFVEFFPRSGSTLFLQMFEETGVCVTYSECHYLNHYGRKEYPDDDQRLEAVMKMYCKPRRTPTAAFVFKVVLLGKSYSPTVHRLFPQLAEFIYIYRNAISNVKSNFKIRKAILFQRLIGVIASIHPNVFWMLQKQMMADIGLPCTEREINIARKSKWPMQGMVVYYDWLKVQWLYLQQQKAEGHPRTPSLKYEDLIKEPTKSLTAVFKHCGLNMDLVPKALRALHKDSQKGTILAQSEFNKKDDLSRLVDKDLLAIVQELGSELGFDNVCGDFRLPYNIYDS